MGWTDWVRSMFPKPEELRKDDSVISGYKPGNDQHVVSEYMRHLPRFTLRAARAMLLDPKVTLSFAVATGPLELAEFEVEGDNPQVNDFVSRQLDKIWSQHFEILTDTLIYGFGGFETVYEMATSGIDSGRFVFDRLEDFEAIDVRPIRYRNRAVGMTIQNATLSGGHDFHGKAALWGMKKLWLTYRARSRRLYGRSLFHSSFAPWVEKHTKNGAIALRRLRFFKDAYVGDVVWYPTHRTYTFPDGRKVQAGDIAREVANNRLSGNTLTFPSDANKDTGNKEWEYDKPSQISGGGEMLEYVHDLDGEITEGMEVPLEIIQAASSGSGYSGRSIPFLVFLSSRGRMANGLVQQINEQIVRPLVRMNFGTSSPSYTVKVRPLIETIGEMMGEGGIESSIGAPSGGGRGGRGGRGGLRMPPEVLPVSGEQLANIDLATVRRMLDEGLTVAEVARRLGVDETTVRQASRRSTQNGSQQLSSLFDDDAVGAEPGVRESLVIARQFHRSMITAGTVGVKKKRLTSDVS